MQTSTHFSNEMLVTSQHSVKVSKSNLASQSKIPEGNLIKAHKTKN